MLDEWKIQKLCPVFLRQTAEVISPTLQDTSYRPSGTEHIRQSMGSEEGKEYGKWPEAIGKVNEKKWWTGHSEGKH